MINTIQGSTINRTNIRSSKRAVINILTAEKLEEIKNIVILFLKITRAWKPSAQILASFFFLNRTEILNLLIYLFLAALGLRCCVQAFPICGKQGLLFVAVRRLLIAVASLVAEHGL